jgi:hypothetical protein
MLRRTETLPVTHPDYAETSDRCCMMQVFETDHSVGSKQRTVVDEVESKTTEDSDVVDAETEPDIEVKLHREEILDTNRCITSTPDNFGANNDVGCSKVFSFVSEEERATAALLGATLNRMDETVDGLIWDLDQPTSPASSEALVETVDDRTEMKQNLTLKTKMQKVQQF